jgi:histidinol-phosphate aminotransferase
MFEILLILQILSILVFLSLMNSEIFNLAAPGVRAIAPYQPGKPIEELEREYGVSRAVKLASNENPLGPSPRALAAARAALDGVALYPDGNGFALKRRLSEKLAVPMEWLTLGNGSSDILDFAVRAFVTSENDVVFSEHAFAIYPILTQAAGARAAVVPAKHWGNDLAAMRKAIGPRTRLVFIANPNNPTGTWLARAELKEFLASLPAHVVAVIDEAYFEYASYAPMGARDYPNALGWVGKFPNLIVARTFSKVYGLAGLRVGYGVSQPAIADLLNRVRPPFNVNSLALAAATAALDDEAHLNKTLEITAKGMHRLVAGFAELGLGQIPSVGNFVCVDVGRPAEPVYERLLREGVIVRPVANYGMPNHLRVTVGLPEENTRFLAALEKVLGQA